jgi:hypothetical protein
MDMDLKPSSRPGNTLPPQAPLVEPQAPVTEDPFKPDQEPSVPSAKPPKQKSRRGGKVFLMLLSVIVLAGAVGYGVFYWQHQHVDRLISQRSNLNAQISDLQGQVTTLTTKNVELTKTTATAPSTDQLVITAVTDYCQAAVDPATSKALIYTQQTSGTAKKNVLYSTDKKYATVTAVCAPTANATTPSKVYYLKYSGKSWVVLYAATSPDATNTKLYAIPTEFN